MAAALSAQVISLPDSEIRRLQKAETADMRQLQLQLAKVFVAAAEALPQDMAEAAGSFHALTYLTDDYVISQQHGQAADSAVSKLIDGRSPGEIRDSRQLHTLFGHIP